MPGRTAPERGTPSYRQIWRVVDGAVREALRAHPDYIPKGSRPGKVRNSITKRVTGAILGYAEQSVWVRSGSSPADDTAAVRTPAASEEEALSLSSSGEAEPSLPAPLIAAAATHEPIRYTLENVRDEAHRQRRLRSLTPGTPP